MVVYTLPTHIQLKQLVKVHVASNDPFQKNHMFLLIQWKLIESYIVLGPTDFHCMDKISLNGLQTSFVLQKTESQTSFEWHKVTLIHFVTRQKRLKSSISNAICELLVHVEKEKQILVFLCNPAIDNEQSRG